MPAKIFISCGQATDDERTTANRIADAFTSEGFEVYVAIQAQSIEDINSGIIGHLRRSDYYVFIDYKREEVGDGARGSLFTNQELAMAIILGFEHVLFFQQEGIRLEGLLKYMGSNATQFESTADLPKLVLEAAQRRGWSPAYSRHLVATRLRWKEGITYGALRGKFLYVDIENHRHDIGAYDVVARLNSINGKPCVDRSHLKVNGHPGFVQIIWPRNHGAFDLLVVDDRWPNRVFLNSALDVDSKAPIINGAGVYRLDYAVLARQFPILYFTVELQLDSDAGVANVTIIESDSGA